MSLPIVMFVGQAGSGKDTAAQLLREGVPNSCSVSLATPIKEFAGKVFLFSHNQLYGPSEGRNDSFTLGDEEVKHLFNLHREAFAQKYFKGQMAEALYSLDAWFKSILTFGPKTLRYILQTLGTEVGRSLRANIWIDIGIKSAKESLAAGADLVTITDGRFRSEAVAIKEIGGLLVKVVDPMSSKAASNHPSEAEQQSIPDFWYDYVITNDKKLGLNNLKALVREIKL